MTVSPDRPISPSSSLLSSSLVAERDAGEEGCDRSGAAGASYLRHRHPLNASISSGVYITVSAAVCGADVWTGRSILESLLEVIEMTR